MNLSHSIANVVEREIKSGKFLDAERNTQNFSEITAQVSLIFPRRSVERVVEQIKQRSA